MTRTGPKLQRRAAAISRTALACAGLILVPLDLEAQAPEAVRLVTADSVVVYGDYWAPPAPGSPLVLMFHQGGASGRAEYDPILPRLLARGVGALVIDQRRGGSRFGGTNRTAAGVRGEPSYCNAYPDLEAALAFGDERGLTGPRVVWGSSYSAALALRLAAEHGESIVGVLAFSPAAGPAMGACGADRYAGSVAIPVLVLRPENEAAIPSVRAQLDLFRAEGHRVFVAVPGTHGSSMLVTERVGGNTDATWDVVLAFLRDVLARE